MKNPSRKTILLVYDLNRVSRNDVTNLGAELYHRNFDVLWIQVRDSQKPVDVFDITNLPDSDIEEVRSLIADRILTAGARAHV